MSQKVSQQLLLLCRLLDGKASLDDLAEFSASGRIAALARQHLVAQPLYSRLLGCGVDPKAEAMAGLAADYRSNMHGLLATKRSLNLLLQALNGEGIEARVLKGLPLARQAYAREADRHCGDIDLLLNCNRRRPEVDALLRGMGYVDLLPSQARHGPFMRTVRQVLTKTDEYVHSTSRCVVEVHYLDSPHGRAMFPPCLHFEHPDWEAVSLGEFAVQTPSGNQLLLYLCSHGTRSGWYLLKWLLDVRELTRQFEQSDWQGFFLNARGAELGLAPMLASTLIASHFGCAVADNASRTGGDGRVAWAAQYCLAAICGQRSAGLLGKLAGQHYRFSVATSTSQRLWFLLPLLVRPLS